MIEFENVRKRLGDALALDGVSFVVSRGEFCVLLGPSGCGKSTALRMINALVAPDAGRVLVRGADVATLDPVALRRGVGYCIQSVGLFPHWTARDNIAAAPKLLGWSPARIAARVDEIAAALQVDPALLARYPRELSGGQQQRVGVARALAADPDILLMDEPFAALDPVSRGALQDEMRRLHKAGGKTILFVTHDVDEALRLAGMIVVMRRGRVVQAGAPADVLLRPADPFVRAFFGADEQPLRLLDLVESGARARPAALAFDPRIGRDASLRAALNLMLARKCDRLCVEDETGAAVGELGLSDILAAEPGR